MTYTRTMSQLEAEGYPTEPLVSYQINRQLSGWNLPPPVIRAFGAHCQQRTHAPQQATPLRCLLRDQLITTDCSKSV
jgi:hypothetical protein